jgi:hypothetical protein
MIRQRRYSRRPSRSTAARIWVWPANGSFGSTTPGASQTKPPNGRRSEISTTSELHLSDVPKSIVVRMRRGTETMRKDPLRRTVPQRTICRTPKVIVAFTANWVKKADEFSVDCLDDRSNACGARRGKIARRPIECAAVCSACYGDNRSAPVARRNAAAGGRNAKAAMGSAPGRMACGGE